VLAKQLRHLAQLISAPARAHTTHRAGLDAVGDIAIHGQVSGETLIRAISTLGRDTSDIQNQLTSDAPWFVTATCPAGSGAGHCGRVHTVISSVCRCRRSSAWGADRPRQATRSAESARRSAEQPAHGRGSLALLLWVQAVRVPMEDCSTRSAGADHGDAGQRRPERGQRGPLDQVCC
jgi:hypothetical protein